MNGQGQNLQLTVNVEILGHVCAYCDGRVNLRLQDCCGGWVCPTPFFNIVSSHGNLGRVVNMQAINKPSEMMVTVFSTASGNQATEAHSSAGVVP